MYTKRHAWTIILCLVISLILGCGSSEDSKPLEKQSKAIKLSGNITGNGYASASPVDQFIDSFISKAYATPAERPDTIVIIDAYGKISKHPISDTGSFSIDTKDFLERDIVALVADDSTKRVYGNLHLVAKNGTDTLDFINSGKLEGNVNFGSIETGNGKVEITKTIQGSGAFTPQDISILEVVARADNAVTLAINQYVNPSFVTEVFARFNLGTIASLISTPYNPKLFNKSTDFKGNSFGFRGEGQDWKDLPNNDVKIYPPARVKYGFQMADKETPIISTKKNPSGPNEAGIWAFFDFPSVDSYPEGAWTVKVKENRDPKARFYFHAAEPFDSNDKVRAPMPGVKIDIDEDEYVTTIKVNWFLHDGSKFTPASEAVLSALAGDKTSGFCQFSLTPYEGHEIEFLHGKTLKTWNANYDLSDKKLRVDGIKKITVSFGVGALNYKYEFGNH